jgi:hypothetical protein
MVMGWGAGTDCTQVAINECNQAHRCTSIGLRSVDGLRFKVQLLNLDQCDGDLERLSGWTMYRCGIVAVVQVQYSSSRTGAV